MEEERMTLAGFEELSIPYKAEYTWGHGAVLTAKTDGKYTCLLYQVESFYVEVRYNKVDNSIENIEAFEYNDYLDTYLDQMSVKHLI